jgi:hypothetical protein
VAPVTVEIEHGANSFYFMAPYRENARERSPFSNERATALSAGLGAMQPFPMDLTVGWRHSARFERAPELTVTYNAQASFDMGESEVVMGRGTSEYLVRLEIARPLGRVTPRAEIGYRVLPTSPYEADRGRSMFGAVGVSYQTGQRSSVDLYFDYAGAPVAGLPAQRNLIVNFSRRVYSRADLGIYAFRSLSEDKAYNAGIRLTLQL